MNVTTIYRGLIYSQVLLGLLIFAVAERNPTLLLTAGPLVVLCWFLAEGPSGRSMPVWMVNVASTVISIWLLHRLWREPASLVFAVGYYVAWLSVVILFGKKTNREYGVVLVLSLLLVVGASVLTASLLYGSLLVAYGLLMLFTLLFHHLKRTGDYVQDQNRAALPAGFKGGAESKVVFGRGFGGDVRRWGMVLGAAIAIFATAVFLVTPRGAWFNPGPSLQGMAYQTTAGFAPVIRLDGQAPTIASRDAIIHARFFSKNAPAPRPPGGWLLRGAVLDQYDSLGRIWTRGLRSSMTDSTIWLDRSSRIIDRAAASPELIQADITHLGGTHRHIFTLFPVYTLRCDEADAVLYNPVDRQLSLPELRQGVMEYRITSPLDGAGVTRDDPTPGDPSVLGASTGAGMIYQTQNFAYGRGWSVRHEAILAHAQKILRDQGLERDVESPAGMRDVLIADALCEYLRHHLSYTLDAPAIPRNREPITTFLFETREGHCELFAAAMAAMTRSLGMTARLVTGYRVYEFNQIGGYYVVRPEHAHAWVEVFCGQRGWVTFDPTPSDVTGKEPEGWLAWLSDFYEHTQYTWLRGVVAYNDDARRRVVGSASASFQYSLAGWARSAMHTLSGAFGERLSRLYADGPNFVAALFFSIFVIAGLASLLRMALLRRRRLVALQLSRLPRAQRRSLERRLLFYLDLLNLLEQHGRVRPAWQSPYAFAQSLVSDDPLTFAPVLPVTEMFYEVRFGGRVPDAQRTRWVDQQIEILRKALMRRRV